MDYSKWMGMAAVKPSFGSLFSREYSIGSVQNCSNASVLVMELLQSCAKPSI